MRPVQLFSVLCLASFSAVFLHAQDGTPLQKAVSHLLTVVQQSGGESVMIGSLSGGKGNAGPGKQREIEAECMAMIQAGKYPLRLVQESMFRITGVFSSSRTSEATGFVDQLELKLMKGDDEITSQSLLVSDLLTVDLSRQKDLAEINGITARIEPDSVKEENKQLLAAFKTPRAVINDTKIRSSPDSPYSVEIRSRADRPGSSYVTKEPVLGDGGQPFVGLAIGVLYEVVIHNNSNAEVAVAMSIDGIDQFMFTDDRNPQTDQPLYTHWLVAPGQSFPIQGWHVTADPKRDDGLLSFKVVEYGKGKASQLPSVSQGKVGVIHLAFSTANSGQGAKSGAETGFGPPIKLEQVPQARNIDPPHDFLTIRYLRP